MNRTTTATRPAEPGDDSMTPVRSRRSPLVGTVLAWAAKIIVLLLAFQVVATFLSSDSLQWSVVWSYMFDGDVLAGVARTIQLTVIAMVLGCLIGLVLALMRLSPSIVLNAVSGAYIWVFRGTPVLVQILFWYNLASFLPELSIGIPFGPDLVSGSTNDLITPLVAATLGLGLCEGAYMAEIFRAGILSVDHGQTEASAALGMTRRQSMRRIILPQAMRVIVPPTGNQVISMLKGTSLVSIISMNELLYTVQVIYARTFETIPLLVVASIWYLVLTTILNIAQYFIERKFAKGATRNAPVTWRDRLPQRRKPTEKFFSHEETI
ncbi:MULTISPECIES: amino acid ABC transporter permease [Aeromicrobium]|uniref:amino acid ABC transporter permease n=1 Tax=Aeromicrobium TaxID=2040 RepID=UPI0009EB6C98|nr:MULTISPECIES: amino acid ABC transporter permease [Aeromicrobium]